MVYLNNADICDIYRDCSGNDDSRLTAHTAHDDINHGDGLWRCGNIYGGTRNGDFADNYEIVFYYRT